MKKYFLLGLLATSTEALHAQSIAAGTISLGGNIGYSQHTEKTGRSRNGNSSSEEFKRSQFDFSPSVGYFFADNLAIGLSVGYTSARRPYETITPTPSIVINELDPTTTVRVGPYVQYYKMLSEQFGVLGTLSGGYQNRRSYDYSRNRRDISETKGSGFYAAITPGIIFFPIPKFGISASIGSLGYEQMNFDYPTNEGTAPDEYENKSSDFGAYFGLNQLQFGGTYFFGR